MPEKRRRLVDMSSPELVSKYTSAVRRTWGEELTRVGPRKNAGHNSSFQKERALRREILRRLGGDA